ncbi:MAG: discoidin domain-containing protein [Fibrobacterales bacterium]
MNTFLRLMIKQMMSLLVISALSISAKTTLYVSPQGNDSNVGSIDAPFKTLDKTREVVRTLNRAMTDDIVVYLRGGTYVLDTTLSFDQEDGGINNFTVRYSAYENEKPVISGGVSITGWALHDQAKNIYRTSIGTDFDSRHLYVDGVRASRAKGGAFPGGFTVSQHQVLLPSSDLYSGMGSWSNIEYIELVGYQTNCWKFPRNLIESISGNVVTMAQPGWTMVYGQPSWAANQVAWIENAYELLDQQGEFYINRTDGYIYYMPRTGENMTTSEFIIPKVEKLISLEGTTDNKIKNIHFEGIAFQYTTWLRPNGNKGFPVIQAGLLWTEDMGIEKSISSISVKSGHNISFDQSIFHKLGNVGLEFDKGTHNSIVSRSVFTDISSEGIVVGDFDFDDHHQADSTKVTQNIVIFNNHISNVGTEYKSNPGITVGFAAGITIHQNTLTDLPYSGISVGWGHGTHDDTHTPITKQNRITNNHISDYMKALPDGGGIYTLGQQNNSLMQGNFIQQQNKPYGYYYLDNGTAGYNISFNLALTMGATEVSWAAYANDDVSTGRDYFKSHDNTIQALFYDQSLIIENRGVNNQVFNNYPVDPYNLPADALTIIAGAGSGVSVVDGSIMFEGTGGFDNIALYKQTSQSSTFPELGSHHAVDGLTSGLYAPTRDLASNNGATAGEWWMVDLGKPYEITYSNWWNRTDCCTERMDNYTIQRSLNGVDWEEVSVQTTQMAYPTKIEVNAPARYIRMVQNKDEDFNIAEVAIYGTEYIDTTTPPDEDTLKVVESSSESELLSSSVQSDLSSSSVTLGVISSSTDSETISSDVTGLISHITPWSSDVSQSSNAVAALVDFEYLIASGELLGDGSGEVSLFTLYGSRVGSKGHVSDVRSQIAKGFQNHKVLVVQVRSGSGQKVWMVQR